MPGRKSLAEQQYYAHPHNSFWPIMGQLLGFDASLSYEQRLDRLRANHIALWDVARRCVRLGSMDHAIDMESVEANDFASFFRTHANIRAIFFNGRKAHELYRRLVLPGLPEPFGLIEQHLLPSTSPAHAGKSLAQKLAEWQIVRTTLEKD